MLSFSQARTRVGALAPQTLSGRTSLQLLDPNELEALREALRPPALALRVFRLGWRLPVGGVLLGLGLGYAGWGLALPTLLGGGAGFFFAAGLMIVLFGRLAPYLGLLPLNDRQLKKAQALVETSVPAVGEYQKTVEARRELVALDLLAMMAIRARDPKD